MFNSTIQVKKKNLRCGHYDFNFSKGRCKQCATIEDTLKRINDDSEKEEGFSELIAECDTLFSKYIRLFYADKKGNVTCYTCDSILSHTTIQCGHYISRRSYFLRFDERNARPQCEICNCHKHGNLIEYGKRLEEEHNGITEILYEESKIIHKYTRHDLHKLIKELTLKIQTLKHGIITRDKIN
jgi:hypothetical protein